MSEHLEELDEKFFNKPEILIDYNPDFEVNYPYAVIYVRPETNTIPHEKSIIEGVKPHANIVYMANLNGKIFIQYALILEHYACQYKFAIYAKEEIRKHPEMIKKFEDYFKVNFEDADIIGAFEAILKLKISKQELFDKFVDNEDFLRFYGQTIKRIDNYFIVNYDLPAVLDKYDITANVFIVLIKFNSCEHSFTMINQSIADEMHKNVKAAIVDEEKFKNMSWSDQVKRTYHISTNHVMNMFDMTDFVFNKSGFQISFDETPFGNVLIKNNIITEEKLKELKEYPIVYINKDGEKVLVNLCDEAMGKNLEESVELIKNIVWSES